MAKKRPLGADYRLYFNRYLKRHIQKNTLFDNYRNIVILITDGYLEAEKNLYTGSLDLQQQICNDVKNGTSLNTVFKDRNLRIAPCDIDLSNVEVYIYEVNERQIGLNCHYDILKKYWYDWLKSMKCKNIDIDNVDFFIQRNNATEITKKEIDKILK